jgi:hypothetical protein
MSKVEKISSNSFKNNITKEIMKVWEKKINDIQSGKSPLNTFIKLSIIDIYFAAKSIDCPYCQKHMLLEAEEIKKILYKIEKEGNKEHYHGISDKISTLLASLKIIWFVILGGLRRAGII